MDTRQAAQEEALMGVSVEAGGKGSPETHRGCSSCAVALSAVMGLVILALGICFILHLFVITPSSRQESPPLAAAEKVYLSSTLKESKEKGRYDIFTVNKAATYLIYGWVKFSDVTREEVLLTNTLDENQNNPKTIQKRELETNQTVIFFNKNLPMTDGIRISIYFNSKYTDSLFHMYELVEKTIYEM